jgi:hypothetical protein
MVSFAPPPPIVISQVTLMSLSVHEIRLHTYTPQSQTCYVPAIFYTDLITSNIRHYEIKYNQFSYTAVIQILQCIESWRSVDNVMEYFTGRLLSSWK